MSNSLRATYYGMCSCDIRKFSSLSKEKNNRQWHCVNINGIYNLLNMMCISPFYTLRGLKDQFNFIGANRSAIWGWVGIALVKIPVIAFVVFEAERSRKWQ